MTIYRSKYNNFLHYLFKSNKFFDYVSKDIGATINSINYQIDGGTLAGENLEHLREGHKKREVVIKSE